MGLWIGLLKCGICGASLGRTRALEEKERDRVAVLAGLHAKPCPNGCPLAFGKLNLNSKMEWIEAPPAASAEGKK